MARESRFQSDLIQELYDLFPGCLIVKNDSGYLQGIPDLTIFFEDRWAMLECKRSADEPHQPNQDYYIEMTNQMSFGAFIFPENKEAILDELCQTFRSRRQARFSRR